MDLANTLIFLAGGIVVLGLIVGGIVYVVKSFTKQ